MGSSGTIGPVGPRPFDDLDLSDKLLKPLWTIDDFGVEKSVLDWMKNTIEACESYYGGYFQVQLENLWLFRGAHWLNQDKYTNRFFDQRGAATRRSPKVVINHLFDLVEQHVSRLTRFRPAVAIFPANSEYQDERDSKTAKHVLDYIWYENVIDNYMQEFARQAKIFGEAYMYITWNPNKGDLHPDYVEARKQGKRVPVLDSMGEPVNSNTGEPLFIDKAIRIGDVEYSIDAPWHTFDMPCRNRDDIDWCIRWRTQDVDYLKAKYPDQADKIKPDAGLEVFQNYRFDVGKLKNEVLVYELFHRHSEFLDKGRYIKCTKNAVLENTDLPYSHGKLPYVRLSDIDVPDWIRGMSFFQQLFPLQHQINACSSLIYKALVLYAHPKIVMPDGACNIEQLANESTIVTYQGGVPPTLMTNNAVSGELFNYLNKLEETLEKLSGIFTMSRGQAPSGVRAAKALRVLEEQEDKRSFLMNIKYNQNGLVENAKQTLAVAGDFYDDTDGRLARVLGKNNEHKIVTFKKANLSKAYDIRIENTTALSQSPAAMLEELNEMVNLRFDPVASPITKEQYIHYSGLGRTENFKDSVTQALECAKSESEDMLSGLPVTEPTSDEELITHWREHKTVVQSRDFKEGKVPAPVKDAVKRHLFLTEVLMHQKAFGIVAPNGMPLTMPSQAFQMQLSLLSDFPLYFEPPVPTPTMGAPMGGPSIVGGVAPTVPDANGGSIPPSVTPPPIGEMGVSPAGPPISPGITPETLS